MFRMSAAARRASIPVVSFSTRGGLGMAMPPAPPPSKPIFGNYCFRATCTVVRDGDAPSNACPVGRVTGFDRHPGVGKDTEYVCNAHLRTLGPGHTCMPAEVVMLRSSRLECSGQMFWTVDGVTKKLV